MLKYTFITLKEKGQASAGRVYYCTSDRAALEMAEGVTGRGQTCEVWKGDTLLGRAGSPDRRSQSAAPATRTPDKAR